MKFDGELLENTISLTQTHLCQAIDLHLMARDCIEKRQKSYGWVLSMHNSISSIIHSFCAFESAISENGHNVFFNEESDIYYPIEKRNYALKKTLNNWKNINCIDKFSIIMECVSEAHIPAKLLNELREFNNLRNWLVHGFVLKSTVLLELNNAEEQTYTEVDREDSVDWSKKFPNTKFNSLDRIDVSDSKKSLLITLSAFKLLLQHIKQPLILYSYYYTPHYNVIDNSEEDAESLLKKHIETAYNKSLNQTGRSSVVPT